MDLIDTNIKPDPFDPQRGDVYESGGPFPQRIVVEIPPRSEDQRIRYRVDGGADSNLTTLGQFHLHLAGLGEIRGVGRVREYPPIAPDEASAEDLLLKTAYRFSVLIDAVVGPGAKDPRSDADLVRIATNARQVSDQVGSAICLLGYKWDESTEDAGHALLEAVRAERKLASDLACELDSISAFIAPHGVVMPAGSAKPTSLELVRWLAVTGGVVPCTCHPTLAEVQEAQDVDLMARWEMYNNTKSKSAVDEPARPEVGEVDHFPSVAEARALRLCTEVYRVVGQLREISEQNKWPIRERLQSAAAVMLEVFASARGPSFRGQLGALLAMSDLARV